ncbi:MFS transporter [Aurantimonas sp. MSK8Z-1]|uniref:MFS transporter n=1 Tax=Mangrovibrevibacter kandeliae TaxID=2968473 RepID=UPI00211894FE|nr:MFS transporter [Aurantimonas sp. MSK8Z-1]MCW4115489.1 MFS transporter [Aurantimonas sp. MSK8Z-1]
MLIDTAEEPWARTLWLMVAVQFIMSAALSVISPILPLFLPQLGVAEPSAVAFWSGVLNSMNFLIAAFVSPIWGSVADRYGRKIMVLRSSLAICLFTLLMGFSQHLWHLVLLRSMMGAFSGFSAAAIALVATQIPERRLGYALGWLATGQLVGTLTGPVAGGVIADLTGNYRMTFFCTSFGAAIAVSIAYFGVTEVGGAVKDKPKLSIFKAIGTLMKTQGLMPLFLVLLLAQFAVRSVQPVITPFILELVTTRTGVATLAGFAFSITGVADLVASPFLGKRSDQLGYRRVLLICLGGAALASLPQAFVGSYWQFLALRFAIGMFIGGILPTANALVGHVAPPAQRGLAYGVTASATFFGSFLGPFSGGSIAATFGIRWVFVLTTVLFFANLIWVRRTVPEPQRA